MYKISYIGDGQAFSFAFTFPFFQPLDVRVAINEVLLDSAQYSLQSDEGLTGGIISFANPPALDARIDIFRKINLSRFIDYQPAAKIDPENLNSDFNFILEAFRDLNSVEISIAQWQNIHDNVVHQMDVIKELIDDKTGGGAALGLYNNLLSVLSTAIPRMINDYGIAADTGPSESIDDYGTL